MSAKMTARMSKMSRALAAVLLLLATLGLLWPPVQSPGLLPPPAVYVSSLPASFGDWHDPTWHSNEWIAFTRNMLELWTYDLRTRKSVQLIGASRYLTKVGAYTGWLRFSPDRGNVLCASPKGVTWTSVATGQGQSWPMTFIKNLGDPYCWVDNRRWAYLRRSDGPWRYSHISLFTIGSRTTERTLPIVPPVPFEWTVVDPVPTRPGKLIMVNGIPEPPGHAGPYGRRFSRFQIVRISVYATKATSRTEIFRPPASWLDARVHVSPLGDRIVWEVSQRRGTTNLQTFILTDSAGNKARIVLSLREETPARWMGWLPDGKQFGLVWGERLYKVGTSFSAVRSQIRSNTRPSISVRNDAKFTVLAARPDVR